MSKLVVSLDDVATKVFQITKERTTLGRRLNNDIVIDNLAISGQHAVLTKVQSDVFIEDLNSTNGTYINGEAVKEQLLFNNDVIEVGKCRIRFLAEDAEDFETTRVLLPSALACGPGAIAVTTPEDTPAAGPASIKVLNGDAAGRELLLTKVVTTVGLPGVQVASVTKRPGGYVLSHVEGARRPSVSGQVLGEDSVSLKHGDIIDLGGQRMQFFQN